MTMHVVANPVEVEARRLSTELSVISGHLNVLHARMVGLVENALISGAWAGHGIRSPEHWLSWQTGISPVRARGIVAITRRRHELPITMAAFDNGELAVDHVAVITAHARSHNDAEVCALAKQATVSQLSHLLARYRFSHDAPVDHDATADHDDTATADPADHTPPPFTERWPQPDRPDDTEAHRRKVAVALGTVRFGYNDDGRFFLHLDASAEHGALIDAALREAHDRLFHAGNEHVTWLDALLDVCERSMGATSAARRNRYRAYVHLDVEGSWLDAGPGIPSVLFDKLVCDGVVQSVWHHEGRPVNIGRATAVVPLHTRRLVLDRDRACRYPGCNATRFLEIHHVQPWSAHGTTDTDNLAAFCPHHHDRFHRGAFSIAGNADNPGGLMFRHPNGAPIIAAVAPTPPNDERPPAPPPGHRFEPALGERFHHDCVVPRDPPPPPATSQSPSQAA